MAGFSLLRWLRDVSISRKLYFTVGIMGLLIILELGTLTFAIRTLSSVRAYVGAEGLWSKAQKDAAYRLRKYGRSHNEQDFLEYQNFLKVCLGDSKTRQELSKQNPDYNIARQGFIEGRIHPDDIDDAIKLFRRFHKIYYIDKAIKLWTTGDSLIPQLILIGNELHAEINAPAPSREKISEILDRIDPLNESLTKLEDDFSYTLGEGSRWLEHLLLKLLFSLVLTVEVCGLTLTIFVSRGISKGLKEIITSADKIAKGDLNTRARIFSADEIGTLAGAFNDMTQKLEENITALIESEENLKKSKKVAEQSVIVKKNFLANISHEIRTPMNAVLGFTDLLESSELDEEQQMIVHSIKVSGENLMRLINDILDYSKIESGAIVLEQTPFSIRDTFESLEILLQQKAEEKNLALTFNLDYAIPHLVIGDPTRLLQILLNLSDNAIKFTDDGEVEISVTRLKSNSTNAIPLEFKVRDTGEGIAGDKFSVIFERFTQVSGETNRRHGGTGLGLSIVKSLVELQHGSLSLNSIPGKGSVFSFVIAYTKVQQDIQPAAGVTAAPPAEIPGISPQLPLNILVAEDNRLNQILVVNVLRRFGMMPDVAENGKIALEKLVAKQYDLVLMDIQMPEMDGYEATMIIRKELKNRIPIVALTAHAMNKEREICMELGMDDFILKPFDPKHLHDTIVRHCAKRAVSSI